MLISGLMIAGAIGAPARYLVDRAVSRRARGLFPIGTLVVNISGSLLLGFLAGLAMYHGLSSTSRTILGTGFCGAYTTFSTFAYDSVRLAEAGDTRIAVRNVVLSLLLPGAAAGLGMALALL
jgi:CrcB protein